MSARAMASRGRLALALLSLAAGGLACGRTGADGDRVPLGAGSYLRVPPAGAPRPQAEIYRTERLRGPVPTNGWWSSLAWMPFSERQYPHPLAVQAAPAGLRVYYPGPAITAGAAGIFGGMPDRGEDLLLGHSAAERFPDARLDAHSDWFVSARFAQGPAAMTVSYGHGSPFVYALYEGGAARLRFASPPVVWSGSEGDAVLGVTIGPGRHYGLFAPAGAAWQGLASAEWTCRAAGKPYFSLALLPDASPRTLAFFARYAHSHVRETRVSWRYDERAASVTTRFDFTCNPYEGGERGTLFALYPHQWRHSSSPLTEHAYRSIRGSMKLGAGASFTTRMRFPGVLPALPGDGGGAAALRRLLDEGLAAGEAGAADTYWEGKRLGRLSALAAIAVEAEHPQAAARAADRIRRRLEGWLAAEKGERGGFFAHDPNWGALIGYPASYGSDRELNDHHFHYGYFVRAAAEIARRDPDWAREERWGGMVRLLIRDFASPDRRDPLFPFLRCFDPYEGHGWASGHARFGDGNNQESSSEAMNAWCALILWGEAAGDRALRDLGVYLYTTELAAIEQYWFDVEGRNWPAGFPGAALAMLWGGKAVPATWFSAEPEKIHGINWLPFHGGSLYLGRHPDYAARNWSALSGAAGGRWGDWEAYVLMYRALSDPGSALRELEGASRPVPIEAGNSRANLHHWVRVLHALGRVDRAVTADAPLYAVFRKGAVVTHAACNLGARPRAVRFSDGAVLTVPPGRTVHDAPAP